MTPVPGSIGLILEHLSVVSNDEMRRVDGAGSSSNDEIVNEGVVAFTRVINQAEMNADRALTMEVEADRQVSPAATTTTRGVRSVTFHSWEGTTPAR